jgi:hypothetical protein
LLTIVKYNVAFRNPSVIKAEEAVITTMIKSSFTTAIRQRATSLPALLTMVSGLAFGFYFATASTGVAQPQQGCQVCHKGNRTLTLPCQSSAVERHLAHGDTAGPCPTSPTAKEDTTKQTKAATTSRTASKPTTARVQRAVE